MMKSQKLIIGLSLLMSLLISISRCNDIINVGWVSFQYFQQISEESDNAANVFVHSFSLFKNYRA